MRFSNCVFTFIVNSSTALLLIAGCGSSNDSETLAPATSSLVLPPIPPVTGPCLYVQPCVDGVSHCPAGAETGTYRIGPLFEDIATTEYGTSGCPYFVLDLITPAQLPPGSATLSIEPLTGFQFQCPETTLSVYAYGHAAAGWSALPTLTTVEAAVAPGGVCTLAPVQTPLGGLGQFDRVRILTGLETPTRTNGPMETTITGCVPITCATAGPGVCGTFSDQCGGTVNCGVCKPPTTCGGKAPPKGSCPGTGPGSVRRCCGTAWVCGDCEQ